MHSSGSDAQTDLVRRMVVEAVTLPKSCGAVAGTKNYTSPMLKNWLRSRIRVRIWKNGTSIFSSNIWKLIPLCVLKSSSTVSDTTNSSTLSKS